MSDFEEAMQELEIASDVSPEQKLRAVCQWVLGYPDWASQFIDWAEQAGYEVKEK